MGWPMLSVAYRDLPDGRPADPVIAGRALMLQGRPGARHALCASEPRLLRATEPQPSRLRFRATTTTADQDRLGLYGRRRLRPAGRQSPPACPSTGRPACPAFRSPRDAPNVLNPCLKQEYWKTGGSNSASVAVRPGKGPLILCCYNVKLCQASVMHAIYG